MDIFQMIKDELVSNQSMDALSKSLGADKKQVAKATEALIPTLLESMNSNVQSKEGLNSLLGALDDHSNAPVDNVDGFLKNVNLKDGEKILGHLLGKNTDIVKKDVASKSGLSQDSTSKLMMMLAPLLMGFLGNKKKKESGFDGSILVKMLASAGASSALSSVIGGLMNQKSTTTSKKVTKATSTKKNDNSVLEDVTDILGKLLKK